MAWYPQWLYTNVLEVASWLAILWCARSFPYIPELEIDPGTFTT